MAGETPRMGKPLRVLALAAATAALMSASAAAETIHIGLASEPSSMDPHYHNLSPNNAFGRHVFDHLIGQAEKQRLVPALAVRSVEHTSELQSLMRISYAVFFLQKTTTNTHPPTT